jgi:hypothetical protein
VFVDEVTDDLPVSAIEVMRIQKDVECARARRTIGVRSAVYVDIHPVRQYFEKWMLLPILCTRDSSDAQCENPSYRQEAIRASAILQVCHLLIAND